MAETFDVLVVGGGLAGLNSALRCLDFGLHVAVLEQSTDIRHLCNSRYCGGLFHVAMDDMSSSADLLSERISTSTHQYAKAELRDALANHALDTLAWMRRQGVRFISIGPDGLRLHSLSPPAARRTGLNWRGRAGDVMLRTLEAQLLARGGRFIRGAQVQSILMQSGRCAGLNVSFQSNTDTWYARAVVLADGGFQANADLLRRFVTTRPDRLLQRNAKTGQGLGLQMAEAVGARLVGTDRFYGHLQHADAMHDERLWPFPVVDSLAIAGIIVGQDGKRFCDEGLGGVSIANALARLSDPLSSWIVFNETIWQGAGRDSLFPVNPHLVEAGGRLTTAPDLAQLSRQIGVDPANLHDTVDNHNKAILGLTSWSPPRSVHQNLAWPITTGPYHAIPACAGITYTMGGILTDARARVQDLKGSVIPGLYAAGATTGGLEGGLENAVGYVGGLSKSAVFGYIAGSDIGQTLTEA